jgi:hypothetical protein
MELNIGGDLNSTTVQDYSRTYSEIHVDGGTFGTSVDSIEERQSLKNISSSIQSGNDLTINVNNNINSIGTNFGAGEDIDIMAGNDINLFNAMDFDYNYSYYKEEKFDIGSAIASMATAIAVGALTGGAGAAAMAGISSGIGASSMTKGSVDIVMNYDETIVGTMLISENINIKSNNNLTIISSDIVALNDLNIDVKNDILTGTAEEKHESYESHSSFGGDIGRAALGGAITGLAAGLGMQGGEIVGEYLGSTVSKALSDTVSATANKILTAAATEAANVATISFSNTVGTAMSQTVINGGSLGDTLRAGADSATSGDTLKITAVGALIGAAGGALGEWIKEVKSEYIEKTGNKVSIGESTLFDQNSVNAGWSKSKLGVNSKYEIDTTTNKTILVRTDTPERVSYLKSNQNRFFKALNLLPGSPSFVDFHDALNIQSNTLNVLTIIPAYPASQFNALYRYYPVINQYKEEK